MSNEAVGILGMVVFVGFVCGIVCLTIAEKKQRSPGGFFLVGLVFGPLGILATVIAAQGEPAAPKGMRGVHCPRCVARQNIATDADGYECWQCKLIVPGTGI